MLAPPQKWAFTARPDGKDIVATGMATTWDDEVTASGVSAIHPDLVACSLPTGRCDRTKGSPFPKLPWFTIVKVYYPLTGKVVYCPLIDEGPAWTSEAGTGRPGSAMIDLTPRAKQLLGFRNVDDNDKVQIRIMLDQVWREEMVRALAYRTLCSSR